MVILEISSRVSFYGLLRMFVNSKIEKN
jgi:hypothetical protein